MLGTAYKVIVAKEAKQRFQNSLDYILSMYQDIFVIRRLIEDYEKTLERLSKSADIYKLCREPELAEEGYRVIHFEHYKYIMIYVINGDTVEVVSILHTLQDVKKNVL